MKKRDRVSNIILPIILRLLGRILSEEKGKRRKFRGRKSRFKTQWGGGEYQVVENFIRPYYINNSMTNTLKTKSRDERGMKKSSLIMNLFKL